MVFVSFFFLKGEGDFLIMSTLQSSFLGDFTWLFLSSTIIFDPTALSADYSYSLSDSGLKLSGGF